LNRSLHDHEQNAGRRPSAGANVGAESTPARDGAESDRPGLSAAFTPRSDGLDPAPLRKGR
jgi:hypothetical protein